LRIKLDENIGRAGAELLRQAGHDVATVRDQELSGSADEILFEVCVKERRALVTLDRDFGQVPRFPPKGSAGIVVLELGGPASQALLSRRLREFLAFAATRAIEGELWIIEAGRVRLHLERD
jgi:predicted nuclease of predicted toxin-antitoxin system